MFQDVGPLIRAWREERRRCAGEEEFKFSRQEVATRSSIGVETLRSLELGRRHALDIEGLRGRRDTELLTTIASLDVSLEAGHVLYDLASALATPKVLPEPRRDWLYNFYDDAAEFPLQARQIVGTGQPVTDGDPVWKLHDPVWAWIRPFDGHRQVRGHVQWGPLRLRLDEDCDADGIFVSCPTSTPRPAARVYLEEPGWVDFGRGQLPPSWMGGASREGSEAWLRWTGCRVVHPQFPLLTVGKVCSMVAVVGKRLGERSDRRGPLLKHLTELVGPGASHLVQALTVTFHKDGGVIDATGKPLAIGATHASRAEEKFNEQAEKMRKARMYSRNEVAKRARRLWEGSYPNSEMNVKVTRDHVLDYERGLTSNYRLLSALLDRVYAADGDICFVEISARKTGLLPVGSRQLQKWTVEFPAFWVGPVCLLAHGPSADPAETTQLGLRWGAWANDLEIRHGRAVTTRQDQPRSPPLDVLLDPLWKLKTFVGRHPAAIDISGQGWHPAPGREHELYKEYIDIFRTLAAAMSGTKPTEFREKFFHRFGGDDAAAANRGWSVIPESKIATT